MSTSTRALSRDFVEREESLDRVRAQLQKLRFPDLPRPAGDARDPISDELLGWSIQMYCFSLVSHFREMLSSFLALVKRGYVPAALVILRTMYEMAAHVYYVNNTLAGYLSAKNVRAAWEFLHDINMGSSYMQKPTRKMNKETGIDLTFPVPRAIGKALSVFNEVVPNNQVADNYAFLSEFSHPNMAAFSHYYRMDKSRGGPVFVSPSRGRTAVSFPLADISTTFFLVSTTKLLAAGNEQLVQSRLSNILEKYVREHDK
jgi:hypothetical protein